MKVSIAIPCYEMNGRGDFFLNFCLEKISVQTYPTIEVVISDHSKSDIVKKVVEDWSGRIDIKYYRFEERYGSSSANTNNAIRQSTGDIIKILCQDDYLYDENAIDLTAKRFKPDTSWLVSYYIHTKDHENYFKVKRPKYTDNVHVKNTIGTHSCLAIRNNLNVYFDEELIWFMDCEYYKRLHENFGDPSVLKDVTVVQYRWDGQVTHTLAHNKRRLEELEYLQNKYTAKKYEKAYKKMWIWETKPRSFKG